MAISLLKQTGISQRQGLGEDGLTTFMSLGSSLLGIRASVVASSAGEAAGSQTQATWLGGDTKVRAFIPFIQRLGVESQSQHLISCMHGAETLVFPTLFIC